MRINKELENLIYAAVSDGELTEAEIQVLRNKAKEKGFDLNEFEIILKERLNIAQHVIAKNEKIVIENKKEEEAIRNNLHYIKKCPKCGGTTMGTDTICKECNVPFEIIVVNSYIEKIEKSLANDNPISFSKKISSLKLPKDKQDLFDLIIYLRSNSDRCFNRWYNIYDKIDEALNHAKIFYAEDPLFLPLFKQRELEKEERKKEAEEYKKKEAESKKKERIMIITAILLMAILCIIEWICLDWWAVFIIILNVITIGGISYITYYLWELEIFS